MLAKVVESKGSDLYLSVGVPPVIRIEGFLKKMPEDILTQNDLLSITQEVIPQWKSKIEEHNDVDAAIEIENIGRFRVNVYYDIKGMCIAFRHISGKLVSFENLGLPKSIEKITKMKNGLVLITGITGSGKSTTLASIINKINEDRAEHIVTIEQPVEFIHEHKKSLVHQREVGINVPSFSYALREDPNVIMVGEMRDLETIAMAISATETGHLVFGTLHTKDAAQSVSRIIDAFPANQQDQIRTQLSGTLKAVLSQILVPSIDGKKRYLACEVMIVNNSIKQLIRANNIHHIQASIQSGFKLGMQTLERSIKNLLDEGKVAMKDVFNWLYDGDVFEDVQSNIDKLKNMKGR